MPVRRLHEAFRSTQCHTRQGEFSVNRSLDKAELFWKQVKGLSTGIALAGAGLFFAFFEGGRALALGWLLGSVASIIRFRLQYKSLVAMAKSDASPMVKGGLLGYGLNAVALAAAFLFRPVLSPWTAIAGLLVTNLCTVIVGYLAGDLSRTQGTTTVGGDA